MLYVQLDTNWPDHPKIIRAGWEAAGVHAAIMCLAKRNEADGWVDRLILERRYGIPSAVVDRLADLDLLEVSGECVRPDGWLDRNPSQAAIEAQRKAKRDAGKRGNHVKYEHHGSFDACAICNPKPLVVAPCDRTSSGSEGSAIASARTATKSESESTPAIAPAPVDNTTHSAEQKALNRWGTAEARSKLDNGGAA